METKWITAVRQSDEPPVTAHDLRVLSSGPLSDQLELWYGNPSEAKKRYTDLVEAARVWMGEDKLGLARAPGRVNLIGEHTDYNGCPVMPVATDKDFVGVFRPRTDQLIRVKDASGAFGERQFLASSEITAYPRGDFGNYPKAAIQALVAEAQRAGSDTPVLGFDLLFHGTIPPAAGMSSSSALVVLCGLVFAEVNRLNHPPLELATLMAGAERYVGTQGGGMDQAASLNGRAGQALLIDFFPLRVKPLPLPPGCTILVADTLVAAPKTESALYEYNLRSLECRLATRVLEAGLSSSLGYPLERIGQLGLPTDALFAKGVEFLQDDHWNYNRIGEVLGHNRVQRPIVEPVDGFKLLSRFRHVFTEWRRVMEAAQALESGDATRFGALMKASHESCRFSMEVSCPELDKLSSLSHAAGSYGSRMTGAGFGGCTVSLVEARIVREVSDALNRGYYSHRPAPSAPPVFTVRPSEGATVIAR